jgi:hypothetical protein
VISARAELIDKIKETIDVLDKAAMPDTVVHVHEVGGILNADTLQKALSATLGEPWPGGKPLSQLNSQGGGRNAQQGNQQGRQRNRQFQGQGGQGRGGQGGGGGRGGRNRGGN